MVASIRRVGPGDAKLFGTVADEVFDEPVDRRRLAAYLAQPGHMMVLALDGDLVVGQCAAVIHRHPDKPTELYLDEVGTAASHRRQGIARAMVEAMLAWGRELGCEEAWVGTEPDNIAAHGLYRRTGAAEPELFSLFYYDKL